MREDTWKLLNKSRNQRGKKCGGLGVFAHLWIITANQCVGWTHTHTWRKPRSWNYKKCAQIHNLLASLGRAGKVAIQSKKSVSQGLKTVHMAIKIYHQCAMNQHNSAMPFPWFCQAVSTRGGGGVKTCPVYSARKLTATSAKRRVIQIDRCGYKPEWSSMLFTLHVFLPLFCPVLVNYLAAFVLNLTIVALIVHYQRKDRRRAKAKTS